MGERELALIDASDRNSSNFPASRFPLSLSLSFSLFFYLSPSFCLSFYLIHLYSIRPSKCVDLRERERKANKQQQQQQEQQQ